MFWYALTMVVAPLFRYLENDFIFNDIDTSAALSLANQVYAVGIVAFLSGYFLAIKLRLRERLFKLNIADKLEQLATAQPQINNYPLYLAIGIFASLVGLHITSIALQVEAHKMYFFYPWSSMPIIPWHHALPLGVEISSSIAAICVLIFSLQKNTQHRFSWVSYLLSVWIIVVDTFRYRLVILTIGMLWVLATRKREFFKPSLPKVIIGLGVLYLLLFAVVNRWALREREYSYFKYDVWAAPSSFWRAEIDQAPAFRATLQYMEDKHLAPEGIGTFLKQSFSKFLPTKWVGEKQADGSYLKPAANYIELLKTATRPPNYKKGMAALLNIEEFYIRMGWLGLIIFSGLFGFVLAIIPFGQFNVSPELLTVQGLSFGLVFQIIIRGYFAQTLTLLLFSLGPIIAFYWLKKLLPKQN